MGDPYPIFQILWSTDPASQRAIAAVLGLALLSLVAVFIPLILRLVRLYLLERRVLELIDYALDALSSSSANHAPNHESDGTRAEPSVAPEELRAAFSNSPISSAYEEFERRWTASRLTESSGRAPIRFMDILDERPLLPFGPRRSLLPVLPGLFLGAGIFAALVGLIPSLDGLPGSEVPSPSDAPFMAAQIGLALRAAAWGFLCAIGATLTGRLIEGAFDARSHALDSILEGAFGSVSPGELAEITRQTQQRSLDTLGRELSQFANEFNERLDRGLQRIEQSTARAANLVSQEQRGALHTVVQELSLSVRQGVELHLSELRIALQRAVEHQTSVTGGLAETFERMVENSQTQDRVARTLAESASAVEEAAHAMSSSSIEMKPILEHLSSTSRGLSDTAERMGDTQKVVARTAEGIRSSLEHAATGVDDQRQFIEVSLSEIRGALHGLGDGLGESLQRSLRSVDDVLGGTIGQLRKTLAESNETIERLTGPIRAAEGSTRETHLALDRVKGEVEALGQWLVQALKPLRSGLSDVDGRAEEISRTMTDFANHTRQMDRTMESLREEIHEESRRLQGTGSELSRRLKLASDAVGLIESNSSGGGRSPDPIRRSRSESNISSHERSWSPAPKGADRDSAYSSASARRSDTSFDRPGPSDHNQSDSGETSSPFDRSEHGGAGLRSETSRYDQSQADDVTDSESETGRDLARSGFRVGAPRAQGPDPYSRFDSQEESPSNVRHFPTPDRELGENLKLSGLLGPSGQDPATPSPSRNSIASKNDSGDAKTNASKSSKGSSDSTSKRDASSDDSESS